MRVYEKWLAHRMLVLEEGRQSTLQQIRRVFQKDVIPALCRMTIHEITRHHLLEVIGRIKARGSLSVAKKMRMWLRQLFGYAVVVPDMDGTCTWWRSRCRRFGVAVERRALGGGRLGHA